MYAQLGMKHTVKPTMGDSQNTGTVKHLKKFANTQLLL